MFHSEFAAPQYWSFLYPFLADWNRNKNENYKHKITKTTITTTQIENLL